MKTLVSILLRKDRPCFGRPAGTPRDRRLRLFAFAACDRRSQGTSAHRLLTSMDLHGSPFEWLLHASRCSKRVA
jgi:hypothetical protein